MMSDGEFIDQVFLQLVALIFERDIVVIPVFSSSAYIKGLMNIIYYQEGMLSEKSPIFLMFYEESKFSSGHYQAIEVDIGRPNPVMDYLARGRLNASHSSSVLRAKRSDNSTSVLPTQESESSSSVLQAKDTDNSSEVQTEDFVMPRKSISDASLPDPEALPALSSTQLEEELNNLPSGEISLLGENKSSNPTQRTKRNMKKRFVCC